MNGFNYDPYDAKPEWFHELLSLGLAVEDKGKGCVTVMGQKYKTGEWIEGGLK